MRKGILLLASAAALLALPLFGEALKNGVVRMSLPSISWALEADLKDFTIRNDAIASSGTGGRIQAYSEKTGVLVSLILDKAPKDGDSKACRDYYWQRIKTARVEISDVAMKEKGEIAILDFMVREYREQKIDQKNVDAFLSKNGYWIDVHMIKANYTPKDDPVFETVLRSLKLIEGYEQTEGDCLKYADAFFQTENYPEAAKWYQKVIDAEMKERSLKAEEWRKAANNLGLSYAIAGDLKRSKETYLSAISRDGNYAMFYYNLACDFAEENDLDNTLLNLEKAISLKKALPPEENLPDPSADEVFKRFRDNERFRDLIKTMKK